ncbi:MAG: manganese efflux pump [Thermaerobacter sp.]|nr:manganese efflux pump [Thermaerobacter sp.]
MPHWILPAILISIAGNLDNLGVGIAYGARRIGIPALPNLFIALVAAAGTLIMGYAGSGIGHILAPEAANAMGALCIMAVGVWVLWPRPARQEAEGPGMGPIGLIHNPEQADEDLSGDISLVESLALAVALGINAWAGGLGGGLVGVPPWALAALTGGFSYLTLFAGEHLGRRAIGHWLGNKASLVAGLLLILIGIKDLL